VIDAGLGEAVRHLRAGRSAAVLEVPEEFGDIAVGIDRAGGEEGEFLPWRADLIRPRISDGRGIDRDPRNVGGSAPDSAGIVGDRQPDQVLAGLVVGVGGTLA
jgi:hypothetical protein